MPVAPPKLPFDNFKWKWASWAPTESLNDPAVFLGVLRVLQRFAGRPPSDPELCAALSQVQHDTNCTADLGRTEPARNLIRNSGQYWKAKDVLRPTHGKVVLTPFGESVARGETTKAEFAARTIADFKLPNISLYSAEVMEKWSRAGLELKPLQLILQTIKSLGAIDPDAAFVTTREIGRIMVPLSSRTSDASVHARGIYELREGEIDLKKWPNPVQRSNDLRVIREYLLFLEHHGYLISKGLRTTDRFNVEYSIPVQAESEIAFIAKDKVPENETPADTIDRYRHSGIVAAVERTKSYRTVLARPQQASFSRRVRKMSQCRCLLTGEQIPDVLEAAHIIPVEKNGSDHFSNGICLRADVHALFDAGHVRLRPNGEVLLSHLAEQSATYAAIERNVRIPAYVDAATVRWRWDYW